MKSPIRNLLPLTVNSIAEKSGWPTIAAISGVNRSFTSAATTAPNARADDHRYRQVHDVAAQQKLLESTQHRQLPSSKRGEPVRRLVRVARRSYGIRRVVASTLTDRRAAPHGQRTRRPIRELTPEAGQLADGWRIDAANAERRRRRARLTRQAVDFRSLIHDVTASRSFTIAVSPPAMALATPTRPDCRPGWVTTTKKPRPTTEASRTRRT